MANITNKMFINSLSHRMGMTPNGINKYLDAIIDEILRETSRGNTVTIDRLGKFRSMLIGDCEKKVRGKPTYIKPRVVLKMSSTKKATEELNGAVLPYKTKNLLDSVDFENENNYYDISEREDWDVVDMYDIFEIIKKQIDESDNVYLSEQENG